MKTKISEETLAYMVSYYLQLEHSDILFRFDYGADLKMTPYQAKKMKKLQGTNSKGHPDLVLYEPRNDYHGLFIELKVVSPFKIDGDLKKSEHLDSQSNYHKKLRMKGYRVEFACGFDEVKLLVEGYLT